MKTRWFRRIAVLTLAGAAMLMGVLGQQAQILPGGHAHMVIAGSNAPVWPPVPEMAVLS
jgi:hypothetical protein